MKTTLTQAERQRLEDFGSVLADRIEAEGPDPADGIDIDQLPPELALEYAAARAAAAARRSDAETRRAVARARAEGLSWHKIALPLGLTAEGARRRYAA